MSRTDQELLQALEAARAAEDPRAECEALLALAKGAPLVSSRFERIGWWLLEAQELAQQETGLADLERAAQLQFAELFLASGNGREALETARDLRLLAEAAGDATHAAQASLLEARCAAALGETELAESALARAGALALTTGGRIARATLLAADDRIDLARAELMAGAAPADAGSAIELDRERGELALLSGDLEDAEAALERALRAAQDLDAPHEAVVCGALLACVALSEGRVEAAADALSQVVRTCRELDPLWPVEEGARGSSHVLLCLPGSRDGGAAIFRLRSAAVTRGLDADGRSFAIATLAIIAFYEARGEREAAVEVAREVATALEDHVRPTLSAPLWRLVQGIGHRFS